MTPTKSNMFSLEIGEELLQAGKKGLVMEDTFYWEGKDK